MRRKIIASLGPLLILASAAAAENPALTIGEAVRSALQHNPAAAAARSSADAAAARARQAKGFRLPRVDLTEMYDRTDNPAEAFAFQLNQERFDFPTFAQSDPNNPQPVTTWMTRLEVVQPLYTGGKLSARIGQASLMAEAEKLTHSRTEEQVTFDTVTAFTNLAKAREYAALLKKARQTTAAHVSLAGKYAAQGMILDAEVLKAKVYLAQMDELVEQASNRGRLAEAALDFQMGIDQTTHQTLAPLPSPPRVGSDMTHWTDAAVDQRRDLNAARRKVEAGRLEEKVARSGWLPEIAVIGRYDLYDHSMFGTHGDSGSIMAVAKINLFRGGSDRAAQAAARYQSSANESNVHRFEEGVRLEVQQAWDDLGTARARHNTALASLDSAKESLRVREQRFKQGLDKMIDLLDAETQLREAEIRELVARYDTALATYRLYFASGTSLIDLVGAEGPALKEKNR
ncbi:MAG: TolC family protein [Acidobacteria bacterium]|nr:TolC family protein [Acidobacteriota bacterium]